MNIEFTDENDERFLKLVEELDQGYYERIGEELSKYNKYNEFKVPHTVILLTHDSNPIACASYRQTDADSVEFKRVYVKKQWRNRGIAHYLIKQLEKLAIDNNFTYSYLVTGKHNIAAIKLYEKLDFRKTKKFGQFRDDDEVICMKKNLQEIK